MNCIAVYGMVQEHNHSKLLVAIFIFTSSLSSLISRSYQYLRPWNLPAPLDVVFILLQASAQASSFSVR